VEARQAAAVLLRNEGFRAEMEEGGN
jgi:hypothetical protein